MVEGRADEQADPGRWRQADAQWLLPNVLAHRRSIDGAYKERHSSSRETGWGRVSASLQRRGNKYIGRSGQRSGADQTQCNVGGDERRDDATLLSITESGGRGFAPTAGLDVTTQIGSSSTNAGFTIEYQTIGGYHIPQRFSINVGGAYAVPVELIGCSVSKEIAVAPPPSTPTRCGGFGRGRDGRLGGLARRPR